jgi:transposase
LVLLKEQSRSSVEVATMVGMGEVSVNKWLCRYQQEGLAGLLIKLGKPPLLRPNA